MALLAVIIIASFTANQASATDVCGTTIGSVNTTRTPSSNENLYLLALIPLNCTGKLYGVNLKASKKGDLTLCLARATDFNTSNTQYVCRSTTKLNISTGLNIFKLNEDQFDEKYYLILWFENSIFSYENGSFQAISYNFSQVYYEDGNVTISSDPFGAAVPLPVLLILKASIEERVAMKFNQDEILTLPPYPIQDAMLETSKLLDNESDIDVEIKVEPSNPTGSSFVDSLTLKINRISKELVEFFRNASKEQAENIRLSLHSSRFSTSHAVNLVLWYPVPWSWSTWSNWTSCNYSMKTRERTCLYMSTQGLTKNCIGSHTEVLNCSTSCFGCNSTCYPCGGNLTCESGKITPRLHVGKYYPSEKCKWKIIRPPGYTISIRVHKLDFANHWSDCIDRLEIVDVIDKKNCFHDILCGRLSTVYNYTSKANVVIIRFLSNAVSESSGFEITYSSQLQNESANDTVTCQSCGGTFNSTTGTIRPRLLSSGTYFPNERCSWFIVRPANEKIELTLMYVNLADARDFVDVRVPNGESLFHIDENSTAGDRYTIFTNSLHVNFLSGARKQWPRGFIIHYRASENGNLATTMVTSTSKPTITTLIATPREKRQICIANITGQWTSWSACVAKNQDYYGTRSRKRDCLSFDFILNGKCALSNGTTSSSCHQAGNYSSVENVIPCNATCINNGEYICNTNISIRRFGCTGLQTENEACLANKLCKIWLPQHISTWSSCQPVSSNSGTQIRSRFSSDVVYKTSAANRCRLFISTKKKICPSGPIYNMSTTPKGYLSIDSTHDVCNSPCMNNRTLVCKAEVWKYGSYPEKRSCNITRTIRTEENAMNCSISTCGINWANWGDCTHECGSGTRSRFATCTKDSQCDDNLMESEPCLLFPCPVDGEWSPWSLWSDCNKTCVGGFKTRNRTCTNPAPAHGGHSCFGMSEENSECNFVKCPVNGGFGPWSSWSHCDQPCNSGKIQRTRKCDSPTPAYGGLPCQGRAAEYFHCNNHSCKPVVINTHLRFSLSSISPERKHFSLSTNEEDLKRHTFLVVNRSNVINDVRVNCSKIVTLVCNFSIFYNHVPRDEIVLFQNQVEDIGSLGQMQISEAILTSENATNAPSSVNCTAHSDTELLLEWHEVDNHGNISSYVVFYREIGQEMWKRSATSPDTTKHIINGLQKFTLYTVRISASNRYGNGISSTYVDCTTIEGVPTKAPANFTCRATSPSSMYLEWKHLPSNEWHGTRAAYNIHYRTYNARSPWVTAKVPIAMSYYNLHDMQMFTRFEIQLNAETVIGPGPSAWIYCKTEEGVPAAAPSNVAAELLSRDGEILVNWKSLPSSLVNGHLIGYVVCHSVISTSGMNVQYERSQCLQFSAYTTRCILKGFQRNAKIQIQVAAQTASGTGPKSLPVFVETCRCPPAVYVSWYNYKPYIYGTQSQVSGVLADFIKDAVSEVCSICNGRAEHGFGNVSLFFNKTKNGKRALLKNQLELKEMLSSNAHIFIPMVVINEISPFQKDYELVLVAEDPGSVLLINKPDDSKINLLIGIISTAWPPFAVCLLVGSILGTCLWFLERKRNPDEFKIDSYIRGAFSGVWWGFVTMTTVGYGDLTPRTFLGKLLAMGWMLIGPVLNGIVVGAIATALTTAVVEPDYSLYGRQVAVVANSSQRSLAVRRNAKVHSQFEYLTNDAVIGALENGEVKAALVDSFFAAGIMQNLPSKNIKVARFFTNPHGVGIVLTSEMVLVEGLIKDYLDEYKIKIIKSLKELQRTFENSTTDDSGDALITQILQDEAAFKQSIIYLCTLFVSFSLMFVLARRIYRWGKIRCKTKVTPAANILLLQKNQMEEDILNTLDEEMLKTEKKLDEMDKKHKSEIVQLFIKRKYHFGLFGWVKTGTANNDNIIRRIRHDDVMITDL